MTVLDVIFSVFENDYRSCEVKLWKTHGNVHDAEKLKGKTSFKRRFVSFF